MASAATMATASGGVLSSVTDALGGVGDALKMLGAACVGPTAAITGLGTALNGLVAKANPVVAEQFTLALSDLMAVVGQSLVPLFQNVFIPVTRAAADALMQLAPAGAAMSAALVPLVPLITDAFAGAIGILAEAVQAAAPFILAFGRVVNDVVQFVGNGVRQLLALVGIDIGGPGVVAGASTGAAIRQVGHSSVEDVVKQAQKSAFSFGNASADPMAKMADATAAMKARADQIYEVIQSLPQRIWDFVKQLPQMIAQAISDLGKRAGELVTGQKDVPFDAAAGEAARSFWGDMKRDVQKFATETSLTDVLRAVSPLGSYRPRMSR